MSSLKFLFLFATFKLMIFTPPTLAITNGQVVTKKTPFHRFIVGIAEIKNGQLDIFCTGSLINSNTIITAAHCLTKHPGHKYIVFELSEEDPNLITRSVTPHSEVVHEDYKRAYKNDEMDIFDVALVQFKGRLPKGYSPALLIEDPLLLEKQTQMIVSGYGHTYMFNGKGYGSGTLRHTTIKISKKSEYEMQAVEHRTGTCGSDSGGPGFLKIDDKHYLWGLTSRGARHCSGNAYYGNVFAYIPWIKKQLATQLNRAHQDERRIQQICNSTKPVLVIDNYSGNPSNQKIIDLNGDTIFETYHGELVEKIIQLNGQSTIRFNIGSNLKSPDLVTTLEPLVKTIEKGELDISWINFSQGFDQLEFSDFNRLLKNHLKNKKINEHNIHLYADHIIDKLHQEKPHLKLGELRNQFLRLEKKGIPVVIAGGNNTFRGINLYALMPNSITVGALNHKNEKAAYSGDNSTITIWRPGNIDAFNINGFGIDVNSDRKIDFSMQTPLVPQHLTQNLQGQYIYNLLQEVPKDIDNQHDNNKSSFLQLVKKIPEGIYDTRSILKKTLSTPFYNAEKIKEYGSFFYLKSNWDRPLFFFDVDMNGHIRLKKSVKHKNIQWRNTIKGTSFSAPNICNF